MKQVVIDLDSRLSADQVETVLVERARAEAQRIREEIKKEESFSQLYLRIAKETGIPLESTDELIRRLLPFASPSLSRSLAGGASTTPAATGKKRSRARVDEAFIARAKQLVAEGKSKLAVSKELGCSYVTISKIIGKV